MRYYFKIFWSERFKQRPGRGERMSYGIVWRNFLAEGLAGSKAPGLEYAGRIQGILRRPVWLELI